MTSMRVSGEVFLRALSVWAMTVCTAGADTDPAAKLFKLTVGDYLYDANGYDANGYDANGGRYSGQDVNLRYRRLDSSLWIGTYHDRVFGSQTRVGADTTWQPFAAVDLFVQPSVQAATQGFVGGSLGVQYGKPWFVFAGFGRTDLRPYQNLNFDPNDAVTLGIGRATDGGNTYTLTTIRDDRLHTGQRHTHALVQFALPHGDRLTLDLLRKTGLGDSGPANAWGESVTFEFPSWFLRAVHDPKQNFGTADATRLSFGIRF